MDLGTSVWILFLTLLSSSAAVAFLGCAMRLSARRGQ